MVSLGRHSVIAAIVAGYAGVASAQVALPATSGARSDVLQPYVRFERISGLAKGGVSAIVQDEQGFMWFGTDEGLTRYDGYEYENYVAGGKSSLSSFTVTSLAPGKGTLWIGTDKGLNRLDLRSKKFTAIHGNPQDPKAIASDFVTALCLGKGGLLWIGTQESGVDSYNPDTNEVKHFRAKVRAPDTLSDDAISVLLEDASGKLWVGTHEAGLNLLDPATGKVTRYVHDADKQGSLSNDQVSSVFQDSTGTVWVGTVDGLNRLDPASRTFRVYLKDPDAPKWITAITEGSDGGLWFGVKGIGVYRLDRKTGEIERYTHDGTDSSTISHPWTRSAFADRGGVLWFGFQAGGISKLNLLQRQLPYYRTYPGMSFLEDGPDQVWLGTQGGGVVGLRLLNLKTGYVKSYLNSELSDSWTMKIVAGDKGSLWIGTLDRGLLHFIPQTGTLESFDSDNGKLGSNTVVALLRDGDSLWLGTFGGGLARLDTTANTLTYYKHGDRDPSTLSSDQVTSLQQDRTNAALLWIGTAEGLNQLDKRTGKVVRFLHDPNKPTTISHDHVNDIHEDAKGQMWVSTWGGGLDRFDRKTGTFTAIHKSDGLASEVVYGILEDKQGALWLTTNDGVTKLDPATKQTSTLRSGDGLQDDDFAQTGFYQGPSGRFYVGGPHGFNVFRPEDVKSDTYVPPLALTNFEVLGESRPIPNQVRLSFRDRYFSVSFSALAFAAPQRNHYKYRLKGFEDKWIETDRRFATYSGLPPGNYTLEILGSNSHGVWSDKPLQLPIHVPPPPWRSWWAYTSYGLFVMLIAGLFIRRQRGQLEDLRRTHRLSELEREMALTSAVQEGFFPPERSVHDGMFRLEAFYRAAAECGGDWWSYEARGDNYFVVVGDATGHGAGSAMVTAAAAASFRSLGTRIGNDERLIAMSDEVLRVSRGQYHMTLTTVEINISTGKYLIRSAGGVPVFKLPPKGRPRVEMCPGTPLGSENFEIGRLEGQLVPGERLLILTDGIPEVALANTQLLGPRGVANFYVQTREQELETALSQLIMKVEEVQAPVQDDDWTAVMVQWGTAVAVERGDPDTIVGGKTTQTLRA